MKKRTWIIIGLGVVLAVVAIGAINSRGMASTPVPSSSGQSARVTRTTLSSAVESSGSIKANDYADLAFGASGTVNAVNAEIGDLIAPYPSAEMALYPVSPRVNSAKHDDAKLLDRVEPAATDAEPEHPPPRVPEQEELF